MEWVLAQADPKHSHFLPAFPIRSSQMFSRLEIKPCQFGLTHPLLLEKICPMQQ